MVRILLIEDDEHFRRWLRVVLEHANYGVLDAANGADGMRLLDDNAVDLIITDIVMPEMDGLEIIAEVKRDQPELPVVAISGRGKPIGSYLPAAEALGADDTLAKPFLSAELLETVRGAMKRAA